MCPLTFMSNAVRPPLGTDGPMGQRQKRLGLERFSKRNGRVEKMHKWIHLHSFKEALRLLIIFYSSILLSSLNNHQHSFAVITASPDSVFGVTLESTISPESKKTLLLDG